MCCAAWAGQFDPAGKLHIPIGVANTLDSLKTFVEAEGDFSPGVGTYGVYFWVYDSQTNKLTAPTMEKAKCEHGLAAGGLLIPFSQWRSGDIVARSEVCEVRRPANDDKVFVDGARVKLTNDGPRARKIYLYVALRGMGPAGWAVKEMTVAEGGDALLVEEHPAIVSNRVPSRAGVSSDDDIAAMAQAGTMPADKKAVSESGNCSGALRFELTIEPGKSETIGLVCPVLPGRRAVGHKWDNSSAWAQLDLADPNPKEGGILQPDPGLAYYRQIRAGALFAEAESYYKALTGRVTINTPDPRWAECFAAITGHVALAMNDNAPDVAVVNYNVFNRDGVYVTNILQKAGRNDLAADAIGYFLSHPFNGRVYPEADNPGQILWIMGEHWRFTRDKQWLARVYPASRKLAAMIEYCRTTPGDHWVSATSLDFGNALPPIQRKKLEPGRCDGFHPEYTEAFDLAGIRAAVLLAEAMGNAKDAAASRTLADLLAQRYTAQFGSRLAKEYGSYCVLWPCRLYPLDSGPAHDRFIQFGAQSPAGWRYFPLATAHQGLLAGNRNAGWETIERHLAHPRMVGWYAFDEGGKSGPGNWGKLRTTWNPDVAMPHGWAVAEMHLLLRDCLLFEDDDRLVLLAGVPPAWLTGTHPIEVRDMPTHFGHCSLQYLPEDHGATLLLSGAAAPPKGFVLRIPAEMKAELTVDGIPVSPSASGDFVLQPDTRSAKLQLK